MTSDTRYITSMGDLKRKDNSIVFKNEKGNFYIPVEGIREIYCLNEVSLNTKLLDFLGRVGIVVHFFNYYGQYSGTFYPKEYLISGDLTVKQSKAYLENREVIAKAVVKGIAENIYEVLYHYYKHGKKELKLYIDWLREEVPIVLDGDLSIKQILTVEGEIWQRFYGSFQYFLPETFLFNKRVKRPPDNPMNALISFGNSILYAKTITQIYHTHLNQSISFLHEPSEGRFSLCLDLSEVFKPVIVYKTIFELVNNRRIQVGKHFDKKLNYCLLNESGKKIFVEALEQRFENVFSHTKLNRKTSYRTAIKLDGYKLIKYIVEGKEFKPFSLKEMA
ncbi:CRISPR-associated endonuclease Cas1 [Clostridium sporogenes]|uniref:type I-B CRISPR-associated endonuclease Cas1b n=1 Tax=Clostridium botulinum TaxID=1491 RepID=UPI000717B728|nr:type I-B CRISPR-associated endonuclease Cas1b [Clostridium botulinum]KRU23804.1 CRISPR-associated endonuclease Cas1 [Clostridium sporogenes]KRU26497.1 CRISPR-associated endonuclease Cas1 [Clostridium sporogenes]KRU28546.1 CRISPR-associated endonuclease Cas1 [Clostridium sporogenes]KRU44088.1 CRISPR-associated endonuclease Cas1 [Clostridium sporogenes]MBZ1331053.1 type I-B CRISPR-associated endonuclease Cas1 [Clostridium botulinum]